MLDFLIYFLVCLGVGFRCRTPTSVLPAWSGIFTFSHYNPECIFKSIVIWREKLSIISCIIC